MADAHSLKCPRWTESKTECGERTLVACKLSRGGRYQAASDVPPECHLEAHVDQPHMFVLLLGASACLVLSYVARDIVFECPRLVMSNQLVHGAKGN
jgi:hypothetical protein